MIAEPGERRGFGEHGLGRLVTGRQSVTGGDAPAPWDWGCRPASVLPRVRAAASPAVELAVTRSGGHVGFVAGASPWKLRFWAEDVAIAWLANAITAQA